MPSLNFCQFLGRLTDNPMFYPGVKKKDHDRATFSIACEAKWRDQDGHLTSKVEFVDCLAWGNLARIMHKFIHKGYRVYITGRMETTRWLGEDGLKRKRVEIVISRVLILQHKRHPIKCPQCGFKDAAAPPTEVDGAASDESEHTNDG